MVSICAALALGLSAVASAKAQAVSPEQMATYEKGFDALQQGTRTFSAEVRQTLTLQGLAQPIVSLGTLDYAAPHRLLLRFSQPKGEWMLVNGTQVAMRKQGRPVEFREMGGDGKNASHTASLLDFFSSGTARWHRDFDVTMTREGDHLLVHLKPWMTPTSTFQGVDAIVSTLQLPSYEIVAMEVSMGGANGIRYEFTHAQRNLALDTALFAMPKETTP